MSLRRTPVARAAPGRETFQGPAASSYAGASPWLKTAQHHPGRRTTRRATAWEPYPAERITPVSEAPATTSWRVSLPHSTAAVPIARALIRKALAEIESTT